MVGLGRNGPSVYRLDIKESGLERKARDSLGRWTKLQGAVERINRRSVEQMSEWAVADLDEHIRREKGTFGRTYQLEKAVLNPRSHVVNKDGFEFMVSARMFEQVAYWRAIEHGSSHMVGRTIRLAFYRGGRRIPANAARTGTGEGAGATGGLDSARVVSAKVKKDGNYAKGRVPFVTIHRPIQAYGYGKAATTRFMADDFSWYRAEIARATASVGVRTGRRR